MKRNSNPRLSWRGRRDAKRGTLDARRLSTRNALDLAWFLFRNAWPLMPEPTPPPPATLVDTLPDLPEQPAVNPRAVTAAKYTAPDCPRRRTTRDASGGIVCDACGEEITRG